MSRWTVSEPLVKPKGITGAILEDGQGRWKRLNGWGHCTDLWVHDYKMLRRERPCYAQYARDADADPPTFDKDGGLTV